MFNFGDGAAAVLLEKGLDKNVILETHMISDGQFAEDVAVFGVGCRNFKANADIKCSDKFLNVPDIQSMKKRLDPITLDNFNSVIANLLKRADIRTKT